MSDKEQHRKKYNDLLFSIRRSVRYHNRRRSFFDRWHHAMTVLSFIGGSGVFFTLLKELGDIYPLMLSAIIVVASAIDLIFNFTAKARAHHDYARKYFEIEKDMIRHGKDFDDNLIRDWTVRRLDIEAEEPPVLHVLNVICHNELCRALGKYDDIEHICYCQRILAQYIDIGEHKIKARDSTC